jgi:hypothetical protein
MKTPEERRAYQRKWRSAHAEQENARNAAWRAANPEEVKAESAAYRRTHPEEAGAWARAHPEESRRLVITWNKAHPGYASSQARRRNYGMTQEEYDAMLEKQHGKCACCGRSNSGSANSRAYAPLFVDHDHKTGKVRGLLCHQCNIALGMLGDSEERIRQLLDYVRTSLQQS